MKIKHMMHIVVPTTLRSMPVYLVQHFLRVKYIYEGVNTIQMMLNKFDCLQFANIILH